MSKILEYLDGDTILFRAGENEKLDALQRQKWDPIIEWANTEFELTLKPSYSIVDGNLFVLFLVSWRGIWWAWGRRLKYRWIESCCANDFPSFPFVFPVEMIATKVKLLEYRPSQKTNLHIYCPNTI